MARSRSDSGRQSAATGDDLGQALQLLAADRGLQIGHTVIVAELRIGLVDDLLGAVPHRVADAHSVLAPQLELAVRFGVRGGQH